MRLPVGKKGGARLAKSMRTLAFPALEMPSKPKNSNADDYDFELEKYKEGIKRATLQNFRDQDNNLQT